MEEDLENLAARRCKPCEGGTPPLGQEAAQRYLVTLPGWEMADGAIKEVQFQEFP